MPGKRKSGTPCTLQQIPKENTPKTSTARYTSHAFRVEDQRGFECLQEVLAFRFFLEVCADSSKSQTPR